MKTSLNMPNQPHFFRKALALVCLVLFVGSFSVENYSHLLLEKIQMEVVDFEGESEKDKEAENEDKKEDKKLSSLLSLLAVEWSFSQNGGRFFETKLSEEIHEVISPPPES